MVYQVNCHLWDFVAGIVVELFTGFICCGIFAGGFSSPSLSNDTSIEASNQMSAIVTGRLRKAWI